MLIKLEVSEPWDFSGPDGDNIIVVKSQTEGHGKYGDWIICACNPFSLNGTNISSLLLSKRHGNSLLEELKAKKKVMMNAYWRKDGVVWQAQTVSDAETDSTLIAGWLIVSGQGIDS